VKYYLISGEASGDLHGAHLISALKKLDSKAKLTQDSKQHCILQKRYYGLPT
jgi:lipid A disaccharide synthetase